MQKVIICLLALALLTLALTANAKVVMTKLGSDGMKAETDNLILTIRGNGLPRFTIARNEKNAATYALSFDNAYQANNNGNKVGENLALASFDWIVSEVVEEGDSAHFLLTGAQKNSELSIAFRNHINSTSMSLKFDVEIKGANDAWWLNGATQFATCYSASSNDKNSTVNTEGGNSVQFGQGSLSIVEKADLVSASGTIDASIVTTDSDNASAKNKVCIMYQSWKGKSTGIVHDPVLGVESGSSRLTANVILVVLVALFMAVML